jgi:two-component system invasion response regulator UvrY
MIRILLADDHVIVRSGIKGILSNFYPQLEIEEAGDGFEITEYVKSGHHDLILLDINMPHTDYVSLIPWIKIVDPACKVLVFSSFPSKTYGVKCIQCGAFGYLHKSAPGEEIMKAVDMLLNGRRYISPELAELMMDRVQGVQESNPVHLLSAREVEISRLLLQGNSLPEIGKILHLGYTTVVTYKNRIFSKLQVDNVLALERVLKDSGLVM